MCQLVLGLFASPQTTQDHLKTNQSVLHTEVQSCYSVFTASSLIQASLSLSLTHTHTHTHTHTRTHTHTCTHTLQKLMCHMRHVSALLFRLCSFLAMSCWSFSSDSILSFARTTCTYATGIMLRYTETPSQLKGIALQH